jgi:hypothetical protein
MFHRFRRILTDGVDRIVWKTGNIKENNIKQDLRERCKCMDCTELAGSDEDPIVGFGKHGDYSVIIVQTHTSCIIP